MTILTFVYVVIWDRNANNFPTYVLIGLVFWKYFSTSITRSANSINSRLGIIEQVSVPKQVFIFVDLVVETIFFLISTLLIFALMIIYNIDFTIHIGEFIFILISAFIFLYGIGLVSAHVGAFVADFRILVAYILWMMFFLTPIFYYVNSAPDKILTVLKLNPAYCYVQSMRDIFMFQGSPEYSLLLAWFVVGLMLIGAGIFLIGKYEKKYVLLK